jgi:glucose/arabinose dehydrogenase
MEKRRFNHILTLLAFMLLLVVISPVYAEDLQQEQEPEPTAEPESAQEAPAESEEAVGGTICVNAFHDENANGLRDENEGYMAGITIVVASESAVVGQAISDGSETPTCFQGLPQGAYQVAQQLPGRLEMTTAGNALVATTDDHTTTVVFGSRIRQDNAAVQQPSAEEETQGEAPAETAPEEGGLSPIALSGLAVILVGVLLLGLLLFFLLRR